MFSWRLFSDPHQIHTPIKYRCPIERSSRGTPAYVVPYNKERFEWKAILKNIIDLLNLQCYTCTPPRSVLFRVGLRFPPPTLPSATRPSFQSLIGCLHLATGQWWGAAQVFGRLVIMSFVTSPLRRQPARRREGDLLTSYKTNLTIHHLVDSSSFLADNGWALTKLYF